MELLVLLCCYKLSKVHILSGTTILLKTIIKADCNLTKNKLCKSILKNMDNIYIYMDSKLLFLFACIPIRILLVLVALYINVKYLPYYGMMLLLPALGFLYLYFTNSRLNASEANGTTWWANLRIVHGLLYLIASILAIKGNYMSYIPLLIDVIFGLSAFAYHYIS